MWQETPANLYNKNFPQGMCAGLNSRKSVVNRREVRIHRWKAWREGLTSYWETGCKNVYLFNLDKRRPRRKVVRMCVNEQAGTSACKSPSPSRPECLPQPHRRDGINPVPNTCSEHKYFLILSLDAYWPPTNQRLYLILFNIPSSTYIRHLREISYLWW